MSNIKLVSKLVTVMSSISRIAKTGHNSHQHYDYVTEADVLEAVRTELAKQKIFVFTSVESISRQEQITTVQLLHTFVDSESGEIFQVKSAGEGWDKGDKGGYKAVTGAMKYFLVKNFLLPSGDDPEKDEVVNQKTTTSTPTKTFGTTNSFSNKKSFIESPETTVTVQVTSNSEGQSETKIVEATSTVPTTPVTTTPVTNGSGLASSEKPKFQRRRPAETPAT